MSNFALEGPKWTSSVVTFSFANTGDGPQFTGAIDTADQAVVRRAIAAWARVANLTFREVADTTPGVDIRIGWSKFGTSGQIGDTTYSYTAGAAQAFVPGVSVELEDPSEKPLTGDPNNPIWQGTQTSLYQVAAHEIGHALGLDHSTDYSSVMYASSGAHNADLDSSDIAGIQALYGAPSTPNQTSVATASPAAPTQSAGAASNTPTTSINPTTTGSLPVYRFFDSNDGTHFFTGSDAEKANILATRPDMKYEGVGLNSVNQASDPNAVAVYRFFDAVHGTHFFSANAAEKDNVIATRPDLKFEGIGFYEHANQQSGDTAVYRFLDTGTNTHFYTSSPAETSAVTATRPDLHLEGIAFYAPAN